MVGRFEGRIERRFLDIETKLYPNVNQGNLVPTSYIDDKIQIYKSSLETALKNAPCSGCRRLVLGALTGLAIFDAMENSGKSRAEFTDDEIQRIKKEVEEKYAKY